MKIDLYNSYDLFSFVSIEKSYFDTSLAWGLAFLPSFFNFISSKNIFFPIQTMKRMHGLQI